jgi:hypothetical protein
MFITASSLKIPQRTGFTPVRLAFSRGLFRGAGRAEPRAFIMKES